MEILSALIIKIQIIRKGNFIFFRHSFMEKLYEIFFLFFYRQRIEMLVVNSQGEIFPFLSILLSPVGFYLNIIIICVAKIYTHVFPTSILDIELPRQKCESKVSQIEDQSLTFGGQASKQASKYIVI